MSNRRVDVLIACTGQRVELDGLAAALVALVATSSLSPRTVSALIQLAANEAVLAAIDIGVVEVVLDRGPKPRLFRRQRVPSWSLNALEEDSDVA